MMTTQITTGETAFHYRLPPLANMISWHADVKAENIILFREKFKLSDFGFSVFQKDEKGEGKQGEPKKSLRFRISVYSMKYLLSPLDIIDLTLTIDHEYRCTRTC